MERLTKYVLLKDSEVAEYLSLDRLTIYRYLREKKIPALRVGGGWRFKKEEIDEWLKTKTEIN